MWGKKYEVWFYIEEHMLDAHKSLMSAVLIKVFIPNLNIGITYLKNGPEKDMKDNGQKKVVFFKLSDLSLPEKFSKKNFCGQI